MVDKFIYKTNSLIIFADEIDNPVYTPDADAGSRKRTVSGWFLRMLAGHSVLTGP